MQKRAIRHKDDPVGYVAIVTPPALVGHQCSQCALQNTAQCRPAPCKPDQRPASQSVHYAKED